MKIIVSNIDWDYPGKDDGAECPLPEKVVIENDDLKTIRHLLYDINGEAQNLAEYLTEMYECCVCGFTTDVEGVEGL